MYSTSFRFLEDNFIHENVALRQLDIDIELSVKAANKQLVVDVKKMISKCFPRWIEQRTPIKWSSEMEKQISLFFIFQLVHLKSELVWTPYSAQLRYTDYGLAIRCWVCHVCQLHDVNACIIFHSWCHRSSPSRWRVCDRLTLFNCIAVQHSCSQSSLDAFRWRYWQLTCLHDISHQAVHEPSNNIQFFHLNYLNLIFFTNGRQAAVCWYIL